MHCVAYFVFGSSQGGAHTASTALRSALGEGRIGAVPCYSFLVLAAMCPACDRHGSAGRALPVERDMWVASDFNRVGGTRLRILAV